MSAACVLYIAIEAPTVSDAQSQLRRFSDAGLNTDSPRVHVSIGEPDTLHERNTMPTELCKKTYNATVGDREVVVWCPKPKGHDTDGDECGPFFQTPGQAQYEDRS